MNRRQAKGVAESSAMSRHLSDRFGRFSSRNSDTRIVKENDFMIRCETICYCRVPSVHVGVEVPQEKQRRPSWSSETTIGVTDASVLNKSSRNCFVSVVAHSLASTATSRKTLPAPRSFVRGRCDQYAPSSELEPFDRCSSDQRLHGRRVPNRGVHWFSSWLA